MRKGHWGVIVALASATLSSSGEASDHPAKAVALSPAVGTQAPDLRLKLLDHSKLTLADLRGQIVVLNLWATWCAPCRNEIPVLADMQDKLKSHGVRIIGVLVNDPNADIYRVRAVEKAMGYSIATEMKGDYQAPVVPTTYVIDRKGLVRYAHSGAFDRKSFAEMIVPLVNEPAA
jgi:cytochrome c biogenesis protein CcmG, thiol:disulfide interchange protein DsbE